MKETPVKHISKGFKIVLISVSVLISFFIIFSFTLFVIALMINDNTSNITNSETSVDLAEDTKFEEKDDYAKCLESVKFMEDKALTTMMIAGVATQEDEDWVIDYYKERKESCKVFSELKSIDELKPDAEGRSIYYKNCVSDVYKSHREWREKIIASWYNGEGIEETLAERERAMQYLYEMCEQE